MCVCRVCLCVHACVCKCQGRGAGDAAAPPIEFQNLLNGLMRV